MSLGVKQISVDEARSFLQEGKAVFLDIRDAVSYEQGHVEGAIQLNDTTIENFLKNADKTKTTIVYCYHGISSLSAAGFFQEQGFGEVFSMAGGFEGWRNHE